MSQAFGDALGLFFGLLIGIPIFLFIVYCLRCIVVVQHKTSMIVERLGKFYARYDAGLHLLIPLIDRPRKVTWRYCETSTNHAHQQTIKYFESLNTVVDSRENLLDFPNQPVITRDNVEIQVHPMLLYELVDPIRVAYETFDLSHAVGKLVRTTLRSIIGDMGLDDTLASREEINRSLMQKIRNVCYNWGMKINRVELLEIIPTPTVQQAMHQQLAAERVRRADIVTAEGYREQVRTEAEGRSQSQISLSTGNKEVSILRAKGLADSRVLIAEAEADALTSISESLKEFGVNPTSYLIGLRYIETMTSIATGATSRKIFFPYESQVVGGAGKLSDE